MLLNAVNGRAGTIARLIGLGLITWSIFAGNPAPAFSGRGLVVLIAFVGAAAAWLVWTFWSCRQQKMTLDLGVLAICGGVLATAEPNSAASAFTFVGSTVAAARSGLLAGLVVAALGAATLGAGAIVYDHSSPYGHETGLSVLAFTLGFAGSALAGANIKQSRMRLEQAQLLLAQTQRSHEEQLRAARLEESTRIARDIHDVLAHSLAGLTIQLEATDALLAQGADTDLIRERVQRAHALAREGLSETRRAVGALRGDRPVAAGKAIRELVDAYDGTIEYLEKGALDRLSEPAGETVVRTVQEALTNVRKHAPGAAVQVELSVGVEELTLVVSDRPAVTAVGAATELADTTELASAGGGYGLIGMRERAAQWGGTLQVGPHDGGWRVELRLPLEAGR